MTRHALLAELLYTIAIGIKKYPNYNMRLKSKQKELIRTLCAMQYLVQCIGMQKISDEQANEILIVLENTLDHNLSDFSTAFKNGEPNSDYSESYCDLLFQMHCILASCIGVLSSKKKGYRETVRQYILAFHNLPRAFLSVSNRLKISSQEAWEYSQSYLKNN